MNSLSQIRSPNLVPLRKSGWIYDSPLGAWAYDLWGGLTESLGHARALDSAAVRPGECVLEVAVGTGALFSRLARLEGLKRCIGVELSGAMLSRARRRLACQISYRTVLCQGDARCLPFADASFDAVLNCYTLDLLSEDDIRNSLLEFRRVLKPTGRLLLLVMARQSRMLQILWMWLYTHLPGLVGGCRPVALAEFLAADGWRMELREQISQLGFRSELILSRPVQQDCDKLLHSSPLTSSGDSNAVAAFCH